MVRRGGEDACFFFVSGCHVAWAETGVRADVPVEFGCLVEFPQVAERASHRCRVRGFCGVSVAALPDVLVDFGDVCGAEAARGKCTSLRDEGAGGPPCARVVSPFRLGA